jgi:hypothetical protein
MTHTERAKLALEVLALHGATVTRDHGDWYIEGPLDAAGDPLFAAVSNGRNNRAAVSTPAAGHGAREVNNALRAVCNAHNVGRTI